MVVWKNLKYVLKKFTDSIKHASWEKNNGVNQGCECRSNSGKWLLLKMLCGPFMNLLVGRRWYGSLPPQLDHTQQYLYSPIHSLCASALKTFQAIGLNMELSQIV